ncbi:hypothetical protein H0H92_009008, partial [Tricholoma furcatifolium]
MVKPDGFSRSAVLATDDKNYTSFPGVAITGVKGDHFSINVINGLNDTTMATSTSIHWHGIFQKGSVWADGPVGVSQCPIITGNSFLYEFTVADQAGTFWYHSHLSTQYCDGLRGPLVIYDPHDPFAGMYDVDNASTIITIADWYHSPSTVLGHHPTPNATLINGLGRAVDGNAAELAVINVVQGKRYRFRIIAMACDPNYVFSIDGHLMTIIEVDGVNHTPLTVDSIQIFTGQRYSVVVNASQPIDNYWIRALPNTENADFSGGLNSAILRYSGAPDHEPRTPSAHPPPSTNPLLETSLRPLEHPGAPGGSGPADVSLLLNVTFDFNKEIFAINGATFVPPTAPVLLQILSGAQLATNLLPIGSVYTLPRNKTVELIIPGGSIGSPVRRDVVSTGSSGDNVTIRFTTDNAGPWFLHCHIDWHLQNGLAIVFAEDVPSMMQMTPP